MPWRALGGYLALAALGVLLALRPPGAGSVRALAAGGAAVPAPARARLAIGDLLAWLATGSADGPYALVRTVLPGMGLPAAAAATGASGATPQASGAAAATGASGATPQTSAAVAAATGATAARAAAGAAGATPQTTAAALPPTGSTGATPGFTASPPATGSAAASPPATGSTGGSPAIGASHATAATAATPRSVPSLPSQPSDPAGDLRQTVHHPLPADLPPPGNLVVYGIQPTVLVYQTDPTATAVGGRLAADLFAGYGIPVAHLRTAFTGLDPYLAAQAGVQALMRRYPSLHILLDVHADAPPATAIVAGRPAAPVMIVVGDNQTLPEPGWRRNAAWAVQLAAAIERTHPGLLRSYLGAPFYTDGGRFDQQLSPAALLLEIGGHGEPARLEMRGANLLAEVLGPMIRAGQYPH